MMDTATIIIWIIVIVIGTIIVQYLFNPYFHKVGLPKKEEIKEKKEDKEKEEEFYREIWTAKKRKSK